MKRIYILLLLLLSTSALSAQRFYKRGVALGADRDTLQYIIASPFDNWWINLGGGLQTFIGNELWASARCNQLDYNLRAEVGKWVIPDLAVSLRLDFMTVHGQSVYGLQPFIDKTHDTPNPNGYYPFSACAFSLAGLVTLDWTNFLRGYEAGKRSRLHLFSPVGLGASVLLGTQSNPRNSGYSKGDLRRNFELCFDVGVGVEYVPSKQVAFNLTANLFASESTWDWSPYDDAYGIFDIIPSINLGVRFNLLKSVKKYNQHTGTSSREKVNHEFLAFGTRNTVSQLNGRIDRLEVRIDSAEHAAKRDSALIAAMREEANNLQDLLDSAMSELDSRPTNVLADLIAANEVLGLPATIVYFKLDKYDLDYNGRKRLQNFAREVADLSDTCEFYIIGAADSATGTVRRNRVLSENRCEAAYNMLVRYCGMNANQIIQVPVGGITDYEPQENNRMAMVILRTPETEEIINRWLKRRIR